MYFHTDDPRTVAWLASVLDLASLNKQAIRFDVDSKGRLRVKRGESMWSAPLESTADASRSGHHTEADIAAWPWLADE